MKRFLIKIPLFILLLFLVAIIGFMLPTTPRGSKSLLFAKIKKDSLLINTSSPRIIFVGGSNLSFGINSSVIKNDLKLNPINTAIHGSIGLEYMMDNTIQYIKESDIVVLAPEYESFYGRHIYGGEPLLRTAIDVDAIKLFQLKEEQLKNVSKDILKYSFGKFRPTEYGGFKEHEIYSVNSFNQYGDVYTHWEMKQRRFKSMGKITEAYNPNAIRLIDDFRIELEKKGATLLVTYPSFQAAAYDENIEQIKKIEKELIENNFKLLGTPERYRMPDTMMFNSSYHLLKKGVDYRTKLLIEDIRKVLMHDKDHTQYHF